jgi:hypothetical protein
MATNLPTDMVHVNKNFSANSIKLARKTLQCTHSL